MPHERQRMEENGLTDMRLRKGELKWPWIQRMVNAFIKHFIIHRHIHILYDSEYFRGYHPHIISSNYSHTHTHALTVATQMHHWNKNHHLVPLLPSKKKKLKLQWAGAHQHWITGDCLAWWVPFRLEHLDVRVKSSHTQYKASTHPTLYQQLRLMVVLWS